jgi:hypothetical protein
MMTAYRIHPGVGIARLGNSNTEFYIAPETPAALPQAYCMGNPRLSLDGTTQIMVGTFRMRRPHQTPGSALPGVCLRRRQPDGRPLKFIRWKVAAIAARWTSISGISRQRRAGTVQFPGRRTRLPSKRRNAGVTGEARDRLIIDPGPRIVNTTTDRRASFDRSGDGQYATTFPPLLQPSSIDTLGDILTDDSGRLLVLGGHGNSGTENTGPGEPHIDDYANTDGWYDDTSDGPVMARLIMYSDQVTQNRFVDVEYPAWVIVGYPGFVPQILDMITMDDALHDMFLREFATDTALYGKLGTFGDPEEVDARDPAALRHWKAGRLTWNRAFKPWFYRDIWPILFRPDEFRFLTDILEQSNFPHDQEQRGTFDPYKLGKPPQPPAEPAADDRAIVAQSAIQGEALTEAHAPVARRPSDDGRIHDEYWAMRNFLFDLLRRDAENQFKFVDKAGSRLQPSADAAAVWRQSADQHRAVEVPATDRYQLFILRQWADGRFVNEIEVGSIRRRIRLPAVSEHATHHRAGARSARADECSQWRVLPGEVGWVMRNRRFILSRTHQGRSQQVGLPAIDGPGSRLRQPCSRTTLSPSRHR